MYGYRFAAHTQTETTKNINITINSSSLAAADKHSKEQQACLFMSVTVCVNPDLKKNMYQWEVALYLSGFVRVFHSGGLLYVDFRCIHTSRL